MSDSELHPISLRASIDALWIAALGVFVLVVFLTIVTALSVDRLDARIDSLHAVVDTTTPGRN